MTSSIITCLTWIRRGVAKETPDKITLMPEELDVLMNPGPDNDDGATDIPPGRDDSDSEEEDVEGPEDDKPSGQRSGEEENMEGLEEFNLGDYDDDTDAGGSVLKLTDLAMYSNSKDDPFITIKDEEDEDEEQDFTIKPSDNLIVVGRAEQDLGVMEVYVYNEEEMSLYVHHDAMLPSLPLAMEWLNFDPGEEKPGNMVAVGSISPVIDVWDIDVVDSLQPSFSLGSNKKSKRGKVLGHTDAVLDLSWNHHLTHILASASADQTVALWDLNTGKAASTLRHHEDKVQSIEWHPFEVHLMASGGFDGIVSVFDGRSPNKSQQKWTLDGEVERVLWDHFNPFNIFASLNTGIVHAIDVRIGKPLFTLKAHDDAVTCLTQSYFVPGCLVTGSADESYKLWKIENNKPSYLDSKKPKMGTLNCAWFSPDSPHVVALGGTKDSLRVIDTSSATAKSSFGKEEHFALKYKNGGIRYSSQQSQAEGAKGQEVTDLDHEEKSAEDDSIVKKEFVDSNPKLKKIKKKKKKKGNS